MDYIIRFTHLHTAISRTHWSASTCHRAPNKPLLLLAVLDLFAQGSIKTNLLEPTLELGGLFAAYWSRIMPPERQGNLAMPFFHLRADGFWQLLPRPGQEKALAATKTMTSLAEVRRVLLGAQLDDELYVQVQDPAGRDLLCAVLIRSYFSPELHAALLEQSGMNVESFRYAQPAMRETDGEAIYTPVRDQGFRRAVVIAYENRCAFCGIRMFTNDGHFSADSGRGSYRCNAQP